MQEISEVIPHTTGRARAVLEYSVIVKALVDRAKAPDYDPGEWAALARLVDTDRFERIGNFKEVMTWPEYLGFLSAWAAGSEWDCSFKRITESGQTVFLELEERSTVGGHQSVVNSLSVYEFTDAGLIHHVDVYLQMPMPDGAMLQAYDGIAISD